MFQADDTQAPTPNETNPELTPETFTIDSQARAEWLLRKLANLDAEKARIKAQADAMLRQIDTDRNGLMSRFGAELEAWTRAEIEKRGGRRKSVTTLQGTVGFRSQPARVVVEDETSFALWAKDNSPDIVNTLYALRPEARDFGKAYFEATGELLPGLNRLDESEKFGITFRADKGAE